MARASDGENPLVAVCELSLSTLIWPFIHPGLASHDCEPFDEGDPIDSGLRLAAVIESESRLSVSVALVSCFDACIKLFG